jgi:glycosyltransferase involved in cell wall biosynthesis
MPDNHRHVISNALPFDEIDATAAALPQEMTKPEAPIILYVGRMEEKQKRPKLFLEALACVRQKKNVFGVLCGEGPQLSELEMLKHKLGLDVYVHFTGYLPASSVWAMMKKASALVSLSLSEGCPNAVMEAMACGCPLVITDIPAHREILDESCALFTDPSNVQQTTNAIIEIFDNAEAAKERALWAKQKTRVWSITEMARNYERVYKECL